MAQYFVPYTGKKPAAMSINGHRLVIVSKNREVLENNLELLGADRVQKIRSKQGVDEDVVFDRVAKSVNGGVVIAPSDVDFAEVLRNLESQLPWLH